MKQSTRRFLSLLCAGILLLSPLSPAALAFGEADVVHLRTVEDLERLAQNCTLDSWSLGKTIYLESDLHLAGTEFTPIPTFGGTFEGQGHTISGLSITGSGNARGLFRYIQPEGTVRDLTVEGHLSPSGRKSTLGGLAGSNRGILTNCAFLGTVSGTDNIGGLTGINEVEGQIINCAFSGSVTGEHYVGGIAGQNFGSIIQCENRGSINTTEVDATLNLDEFNRNQLNATENVPVCTDIGGIAGFSTGVLQGCVNSGPVGYAHVGYNIGGIVGRQSGYLDGCANSGTILGRKDVGGIVGQLEPEVRLLYNESQLGNLLDELDVLRSLVDQAGENIRGSSDMLSQRMQAISDRTGEAQEAISDLADSTTEWANGNIGEINHLIARLSWLVDNLAPLLGDAADIMDLADRLAGQLNDAMVAAQDTGDLAPEVAEQFAEAAEHLQSAALQGRSSVEHLRMAVEHLRNVLGRPEHTAEAVEEVVGAAVQLLDAISRVSDATVQAVKLLAQLWQGDQDPEYFSALQAALAAVHAGLDDTKTAALALGGAIAELVLPTVHPDEWEAALKEAKTAGELLASTAQSLSRAAGDSAQAVRQLKELFRQAGDVLGYLRAAGDTSEEAFSLLAALSDDLYQVFRTWSELPTITLRPISDDLQAQGDVLGDIFSGLLDDEEALRAAMSTAGDTLLDDLAAINRQFGVITDLLRDFMTDSGQEPEDRFEDISDEELGGTETGALSRSRNAGTVEGDVNVAGIVGSMAIEYDFDPEDDLIQEGSRSLDFRYQTRAVVISCVNTGDITGKQDNTGGVVGLMDLGRVSACENYGFISSTNGDYVGGIAGASWGSLRDSWSKCHLSGGDYVGGIAGFGATLVNCHALVSIDQGSAFLGAVAGDIDSAGTVSGNTFTGEGMGALDGISYAGKAEPVDFDSLCTTPGIPELFSQLELTFLADGATVAVIPFPYGEGIHTLPEIPEKKGYSASWPELDYTHLTANQTLEAVYTPYTSALTDGGELPQLLVDGSFSSRATVSHTTKSVTWIDTQNVPHTGTAYTVKVDDPDLEEVSYTVHYRLPDVKKQYSLWVLEEAGWSEAHYELDGQYLLLSSQSAGITFCIVERSRSLSLLIVITAGWLFLITAAYIRHRRRKKRQR